jgi:hypothetical protein
LIWPVSPELPVHPVQRTGQSRVGNGGFHRLAADGAAQAHLPHQPRDRAARHLEALARQLSPHFAHPIDLEIRVEHPPDLGLQASIPLHPRRPPGRVRLARRTPPPGRWGDRQHLADRLDPIVPVMGLDEAQHHFCRRSSSAIAK